MFAQMHACLLLRVQEVYEGADGYRSSIEDTLLRDRYGQQLRARLANMQTQHALRQLRAANTFAAGFACSEACRRSRQQRTAHRPLTAMEASRLAGGRPLYERVRRDGT